MNKKLIDQIKTVESPDFDSIYRGVERRIAVRRITIRSVAVAAILIIAAVILFPHAAVHNQEDLLSYSDESLEFTDYDPLAPLFEEPQ